MRITEKRYPLLKYYNWDGSLFTHKDFMDHSLFFTLAKDDIAFGYSKTAQRIGSVIARDWARYRKIFGKEIFVTSEPLSKVIVNNADKLLTEDNKKILFQKGPIQGTLIWHELVICYNISDIEQTRITGELFVMYGKALIYATDGNISFSSSVVIEEQKRQHDEQEAGFYYRAVPVLFHLFKRYAEVEIVDAKPFKKVSLPLEEGMKKEDMTILNDFHLPIKFMDCSWYRTIVRKEGFMVRGHFRMQPYKNEKREWDYKLIYIEPFQKHGYTRTAKKVVEARRHPDETTQG